MPVEPGAPDSQRIDLSSLARARVPESTSTSEIGLVERVGPAAPAIMHERPRRAQSSRMAPRVTRVLSGLGLIVAYFAICLSPLAIVSIFSHAPSRPFLIELSVALGYVGLAMMVMQFVLVSRVRWLAAPFGIDILQRFHREIAFVAMAFVFAHPLLLLVQSAPTYLPLFDMRTAPWRARYAVSSVVAMTLVVLVSVWRRWLRVPYEVWRVTHRLLSVAIIVLALLHMIGVNRLTSQPGGMAVV